MMRCLGVLLLAAALALANTSVTIEIADTDPLSAEQVAQQLERNFASLGLGITSVERIADSGDDDDGEAPPPVAPPVEPQPVTYPKHPRWWRAALVYGAVLCTLILAVGLVVVALRALRQSQGGNSHGRSSTRVAGLLCIALLLSPARGALDRTYANCHVLHTPLNVRLHWTLLPAAAPGAAPMLQLALEGDAAAGWLALGIPQNGAAAGSLMDSGGAGTEMTIGYAGAECATAAAATVGGCLADYWSAAHALPHLAASQLAVPRRVDTDGARLTLEWDRPLGVAAEEHVLLNATAGAIKVIFAAHPTQQPEAAGSRLAYHGLYNRGARVIDLARAPAGCAARPYANVQLRLQLETPFSSFDAAALVARLGTALEVEPERLAVLAATDATFACADCVTDEFRFPDVAVTSSMGQTNYLCVDFAFPDDALYHAVKFDPLVDASAVVHHMILFSLSKASGRPAGTAWDCARDMPDGAVPLYLWAVGAASFAPPEDVGFRIGKGAARYATLQIHYNNPSLGNYRDSSGVRVYRTPTLRPQNGGWIFLGYPISKIAVPPGVPAPDPRATVTGVCPESLVELWTAQGEVRVFAFAAHAHLLGRAVVTEHFRDGQIIARLGNEPYNFNEQHPVMGDWRIRKGDHLVTTCTYDSSDRTGVTRGGIASTDEMCFNIMAFTCPEPCPTQWAGNGCIDRNSGQPMV